MKVCPQCGFRERANFRTSRFDYNADYLRTDEALQLEEYKPIVKELKRRPKGDYYFDGKHYIYYLRGSGQLYFYRVPYEDYKVGRERKNHKDSLHSTRKEELE